MQIITSNTILYCRQWQQVVDFYETVLGFRRLFSNDWFVELEINEAARLSIANEAKASIKSGDGKGITIALQIIDLQTLHGKLQDAGVQPTPVRKRWGAEVFYVIDPEGNRLEFWSSVNG